MMERSGAEETVSGRIWVTLRYARRRLGLDEVLRFAVRNHSGVIDARWSPTDAYRRSRSAGAASSASSAFWGQGAQQASTHPFDGGMDASLGRTNSDVWMGNEVD